MTPASETLLNLADGSQVALGPENAPTGQRALGLASLPELRRAWRAAFEWLDSAMQTVQQVYPSCDWGRSVDPVIEDEFHFALEWRFLTGTMDEDEFKAVWRRWYSAHR